MSRRGPQPKAGVIREPNGRVSRKKKHVEKRKKDAWDRDEIETMAVALKARWRVHGVDAKHAANPLAGSAVGRLVLTGNLKMWQYDAAQQFVKDRAAYDRALDGPKQINAVDLNKVNGRPVIDDDNEMRRHLAARDKYMAAWQAIKDEQDALDGNANLMNAISYFLMHDHYIARLEGDLRLALNALAHHYGIKR